MISLIAKLSSFIGGIKPLYIILVCVLLSSSAGVYAFVKSRIHAAQIARQAELLRKSRKAIEDSEKRFLDLKEDAQKAQASYLKLKQEIEKEVSINNEKKKSLQESVKKVRDNILKIKEDIRDMDIHKVAEELKQLGY